ncbi:MAG: glucokinase [Pseudomonadota bacterium]
MSTGVPKPLRLVADIGGSNARFGLLRDGASEPVECRTLPTGDFPNFVDAVEQYLKLIGSPVVTEAAVAIANPVTGDAIKMTNQHWAFSTEQARKHLGLDRLLMLNDFAALAMSLPKLAAQDLRQLGGTERIERGPCALLGPGTGLGVSALLPAAEGRWVPLSGEGGHITVAAGDDYEAEIIGHLRREFGHVSAERVLSGMGLCNLYRAVAQLAARSPLTLTPAEITQRGLSGEDPDCAEALSLFCSLLGNAAGSLALIIGARGGVYIGGGIVPRLGDYFHQSKFRARFEAKGRMSEYLIPIPAYVIHTENPALLGAAIALDSP